MLELTFSVGENRTRLTTRRLTPPSVFNDLIKDVKVFREFSRRVRELDFGVLKAQEMRNIILFLFPIVIQCIESNAKERRLWFLLAFMMRSCVIPECEFCDITKEDITRVCEQFYILFQDLFGTKNCTYSIHMIASHLLEIRALGPLTSTSAFIFENFYGELRQSFVPGTVSGLKQMLQTIYLKRKESFHCCEKTIYYSEKDTALERNSLIYIHENSNYNMYKIITIEKNNPELLICNIQGKVDIDFSEAMDINWSQIGVFKEGATGNEVIRIPRSHVHGKVMKVCSLLITCPLNVLQEK